MTFGRQRTTLRMKFIEISGTPYYVAIAPTPDIGTDELEEVRLTPGFSDRQMP